MIIAGGGVLEGHSQCSTVVISSSCSYTSHMPPGAATCTTAFSPMHFTMSIATATGLTTCVITALFYVLIKNQIMGECTIPEERVPLGALIVLREPVALGKCIVPGKHVVLGERIIPEEGIMGEQIVLEEGIMGKQIVLGKWIDMGEGIFLFKLSNADFWRREISRDSELSSFLLGTLVLGYLQYTGVGEFNNIIIIAKQGF